MPPVGHFSRSRRPTRSSGLAQSRHPPPCPTHAHLNSLLEFLDIQSWKPLLTALFLPPVPLLLMVLVGARLLLPRRGLGWLVIVVSVALLWVSACVGTAQWLTRFLLQPPLALSASRIGELKADVRAGQRIAIVVLGGGLEPYTPEYGVSDLSGRSLERLRYGVWLGQQTGAPLAFSGGIGWGNAGADTPEAQIAARIAAQEYGRPIKWVEDQSRDTRENAGRSVALLSKAGIDRIVLVTHGWHMPRSRRAFEAAAAGAIQVEPAPMGLATRSSSAALAWIPSSQGTRQVSEVLHELLGIKLGF
jgi:uncharacterized SAM-binding protein YcdF (DUF218 family)